MPRTRSSLTDTRWIIYSICVYERFPEHMWQNQFVNYIIYQFLFAWHISTQSTLIVGVRLALNGARHHLTSVGHELLLSLKQYAGWLSWLTLILMAVLFSDRIGLPRKVYYNIIGQRICTNTTATTINTIAIVKTVETITTVTTVKP